MRALDRWYQRKFGWRRLQRPSDSILYCRIGSHSQWSYRARAGARTPMLVSAQPQVTGSGFREWTAYSRVFFFFFNVYFVFPHGLINILVFNFFLISLFLLSSPPFMSLSLSLSQLFPPSLILHPSLPLSLSPHLPLASPSIPSCQCIQEYRLCFPGILLRLNSLPSNFQRFLFHFA